jgi:hypothetical protein
VEGKTLLEIAKGRDVSYEAICHTKDRRNIQQIGKRGRAGLYNPADSEEKKTTEAAQQSADYRRRFEKARAEKLEIENAKKRGELIDRVYVAQVFSEIYGIHRGILLNIAPGLSDTIAAIAGASGSEKTLKIQETIDNEIYSGLAAIKAGINKFLRKHEAPEIKDGLPEPKPKARASPAAKRKKKPA